ncbi:uncharacterized protein isoform X6 [Danio rerio]|uniref:Uncharacterized protein isoform X6 n=1 Tax=Danio rerio TaxID=7955 RepID=A0AC58IGV5_DANRE
MKMIHTLTLFLLHLIGVFGVDEVSVKEGDSVTLHIDLQIEKNETLAWKFNNTRIAKVTGDNTTYADERFTNRLKLDHQTGSLTITNTRSTDSGVYTFRTFIKNEEATKTFSVTVYAYQSPTTITSNPNPLSTMTATDCNLCFDSTEAVIRLVVTALMGVAALAAVVVLVYDIKTRQEERINTTSFRD